MLASLVSILLQPATALFAPESRFYWLYLMCTVIVAVLACKRRLGKSGNGSLSAPIREVFNPSIFFHPSAIADYKFVFINHFFSALKLGAATITVEAITHGGAAFLAHVIGPASPRVPGMAATVMFTVTGFLAADFGNFYFHLQQHRSPFLWELHKVHHSAEVLTPLTALRVHPIADLLATQFIALCVGLPGSIYLYFYSGPVAELRIAGINLLLFLWQTVLVSNLAHSHVWVMFPRGIREIFYSPALHLIHHSASPNHYGKNLGFALTLWDRLAGSLYEPTDADRRDLVLGIDPDEMRGLRTVGQLYWTPLRNIIFAKRRMAASEP
jgi:sterol desaturase/sphingolipid hydroxylase (fatty acid hydroxylase superfamily)